MIKIAIVAALAFVLGANPQARSVAKQGAVKVVDQVVALVKR